MIIILSLTFFLIPRLIKKLDDTGDTGTPICSGDDWTSPLVCNRVFHKLDEIGNNANIGIKGFTM